MKEFIIAVLLVAASSGGLMMFVQHTNTSRENAAYDLGGQSCSRGISPEANPYKGYSGAAWLKGWMDCQDRKNKRAK